jgi:catechol 2,3-dioxygenase-like lactoylglutathione lyase family enzyme
MLLAIAAIAAVGCAPEAQREAAPAKVEAGFASPVVSFGLVVSDLDRASNFYRNALGLTEVPGFDVPKEVGGDSGLTAYKGFHVRVFVAEQNPGATQIKLMAFKDALTKPNDNAFIHSELGVRYLTVHVKDITAALARIAKWGVLPIGKGPMALPATFPKGLYLAIVRDPDGNMIELVGPKAPEPVEKPAAEKPKGEKPKGESAMKKVTE